MEDWIDRYRFFVICFGTAVIPIFFFPFTPDDPFLLPKQILLAFLACSLGIVVLYPVERFLENPYRIFMILSLAFLACITISIPGSTNYHAGTDELKRWIFLLILFLTAIQVRWTGVKLRTLMITGVVISCIVGISAILEYFHVVPFSVYPFAEGRIYSFFGHQNIMAQYLAIMVLWGAGLVAGSKTFKMKALFFILSAVSGLALLLTFCRAGIAAAILSLSFFVLHFSKVRKTEVINKSLHRKPLFFVISMLLCLMVVIVVLLLSINTGHFSKIHVSILDALSKGDSSRFIIYKDSIRMFLSHPFTGVGLGNYSIIYPSYETKDFPWLVLYAYNELLHMLTETGIVGLSGFLLFFVIVFRHLLRQFTASSLSGKLTLLGIVYGGIVTVIQSMLSYDLHSAASSYIFFISLGILCAERSTAKMQSNPGKIIRGRLVIASLAVFLSLWGLFSEYERIKGHYFYNQAIISIRKDDLPQGISYIQRALLYQPYNPEYHFMIAWRYRGTGQVQLAEQHFQKAHALSPYLFKTGDI